MSSDDSTTGAQSATERWYYVRRGEPRGPVTLRYLKALFENGELDPETLVRGPGVDRWQPASAVVTEDLLPSASAIGTPEDLPERIDLEPQAERLQIFEEMQQARRREEPAPPTDPEAISIELEQPPELPAPEAPAAPLETADGAERLSPFDTHGDSPQDRAQPASPYEQPEPEDLLEEDDLDLDDVLGEVERHREASLDQKRRVEIRKASHRQRFEQIADQTIKPALRQLMQRLHRRGYPTRLREMHRHHLRFEFTLETSRIIRCTLEIALREEGRVEFVFLRDLQPLSEELILLDDLEAERIRAKLAAFVKMSLR